MDASHLFCFNGCPRAKILLCCLINFRQFVVLGLGSLLAFLLLRSLLLWLDLRDNWSVVFPRAFQLTLCEHVEKVSLEGSDNAECGVTDRRNVETTGSVVKRFIYLTKTVEEDERGDRNRRDTNSDKCDIGNEEGSC